MKDQFYSVLNGFLTQEEKEKKQRLDVAKFARIMSMKTSLDVPLEDRAMLKECWQIWRKGESDREAKVLYKVQQHRASVDLKKLVANVAAATQQH